MLKINILDQNYFRFSIFIVTRNMLFKVRYQFLLIDKIHAKYHSNLTVKNETREYLVICSSSVLKRLINGL